MTDNLSMIKVECRSKRRDQPKSDLPSLTYRIIQKKTPLFFFTSIFLSQSILHVFPHANPTRFPSTDLSRATTIERCSVLSAPWREQPPYRFVPFFEHFVLSLIRYNRWNLSRNPWNRSTDDRCTDLFRNG